ncbi:MAG TPA: glycoside hydrolase family 2 TIM barrel-domain containing protein [Rubellimicrobium sp.]|nr:glycoside hydrolase family 2 TIM barrel-domain containing protein [Rubellimicrobium sp.]
MRSDTPCNDAWTFAEGFDPAWVAAPLPGRPVELPHAAVELPMSYFDETAYQRPFTYQRVIAWEDRFEGQEVTLVFEGAMADAQVWVNGREIVRHRDGYTPFEARLTGHLTRGDNLVTVRIDGSENPEIPPFGGQIDYLTYAGIYREVWLRVTAPLWIANVKIETPEALADRKSVRARVWLLGEGQGGRIAARLLDAEGGEVAWAEVEASGGEAEVAFDGLEVLRLWRPQDPALCTLELVLTSEAGQDRLATRFGFREARFTPEGFLLNGEPLKLMGLNRHQSFPYSGYAQGRRSQERDAEILKWDLGCNVVRTSHYPQSRHFLDRCDEIGLLCFEEIPGWQHIGGAGWKAESVENVRRMVERDWNHPSIILWGVRINESQDDHDFYSETNRVAHDLDRTRQTGGVRFITESEMLEDVYTLNDFILGDFENPRSNRPRTALRSRRETTGLPHPVPYLITEYNGHMFPTKAWDQEQRQAEHIIRHLEVLNAAFGDPEIAGAIGWCFFDYNTHKDFGSGDRICHHGVTTIFREPKFAAYAYASQRDPSERVVMQPVTFYARGERNIGGVLPLVVLTNCDEVELRYGEGLRKRVGPDRERFPHLPHAPVVIDHRHFTAGEMGLWGMSWEDCEVVGYLGGQEVARQRYVADPLPTTLEVAPDAVALDAKARDEVRVIVRALDQAGNLLPFLQDAVRIEVDGPVRLIGPGTAYLAGGTTGFWLRATGGTGAVRVRVTTDRFAPAVLHIQAE